MRHIVDIGLSSAERFALWTGILRWPGNIVTFAEATAALRLLSVEDLVQGTGMLLRRRLSRGDALTNSDLFRLLRLLALVLDRDERADDPRTLARPDERAVLEAAQGRIADAITGHAVPTDTDLESEFFYSSEPADTVILNHHEDDESRQRLVYRKSRDDEMSWQVEDAVVTGRASLWISNDVLTGPDLEAAIGVEGDEVTSIGDLVRPRGRPKPEVVSTWEIRSGLPDYAFEDEHLDALWTRAAGALTALEPLPGTTEAGLVVYRHHNAGQWQGHGSGLEPPWIALLARLGASYSVDAYVEDEDDFLETWRKLTS